MRASEFIKEQREPSIGYHVTRTKNLSSIQNDGINPDNRGNTYIWDTLEMAEWFKDFQNDNDEDRTIIKLDVSGLPMTIDTEATDMSEWSSQFQPGQPGGAWIIKGKIPADRIVGMNEAKYDYPLQDFIDTPYDPGQEWQEEIHNQTRQSTKEPTRHRGPQEGKYLNLMLKGIKPVSVVSKEFAEWTDIFWPYVKAGKIVLVDEDENDYYFSLPGEEWRARKVKKLFAELEQMWDDENFSIEKEKLLHAKIGRLLGIPKESVRYFINN